MNYDFGHWGKTPLELFDEKRWAECLHATIEWYNLERNVIASQDALQDTGVLHELAHLVCGIETNGHRSVSQLRQMLPDVDVVPYKGT